MTPLARHLACGAALMFGAASLARTAWHRLTHPFGADSPADPTWWDLYVFLWEGVTVVVMLSAPLWVVAWVAWYWPGGWHDRVRVAAVSDTYRLTEETRP